MSEVKTYITKEKIIANYQLQIDALAKENEELKLALFDRSEKYKIAMDKGVLQLGDEIKSLRTSLKLAVEALEQFNSVVKDRDFLIPNTSWEFSFDSSVWLKVKNALAKIKTKHGEL